MWQQLNKIEDEMLFNEIIDEPIYDEIFGMPYDYEEREVGREFLSDLKSYEAVPADDQLKESKRNHKKKNLDQSGNHHRQTKRTFKKMDPHEQTVKQEEAKTQKQANLVEEQVNLQEQANLHRQTNLKKHADQTAQQDFDQPQATDANNLLMSPPEPFISWGRQHLPNWDLASNPSPPASPFTFQSSPDSPTLRNIFGSSPTKGPDIQSEGAGVWALSSIPKKPSDSKALRPKRNGAWERKDDFNPPEISYYFTLDDAINR